MSDPTRDYIEQWLKDERDYTINKFGLEVDDTRDKQWWDQQFSNYFHRAYLLGLDTPNGRQAAAKFVATALGFLESVVRVHGELPEPGVPSGYNLDNMRKIYGTG